MTSISSMFERLHLFSLRGCRRPLRSNSYGQVSSAGVGQDGSIGM